MLYIIPFAICVLLIVIDQYIKYLAVSLLMPVIDIPIIKGFFHLTYVENRGAAFGVMSGARWFFVILTILITLGMIFYYFKIANNKGNKLIKTSIVLIVSGAIGNFIDRLFKGYVVDMFHFTFFKYDFPVFNAADIFVVCGTFLLAVMIILKDSNSKKIKD